VQMVFFKEIRSHLGRQYPDKDVPTISMLAGALTNELFGTPNPEPKFIQFMQANQAIIEQELLGLAANLPHLRRYLTDALRIQTLCDNQEGVQSAPSLITADKLGVLLKDRDVPLPSAFMTSVRELGALHQLIIPPAQISPEDDRELVH